MYCISDEQIDFILNDISARGVKMETLQQDLLDHVCCIIEQNLEENGDFELFYNTTIRKFYKTELSEIEKETNLLLTFKNYYSMKKTMIISGALSAAAFIAGSFFKIMHYPGAGVLLFSGFLLISFIFLPLMCVLKIRESGNTRDKILAGMGTLLGILYCFSMLFQVNHWPGSRIIWLTTLVITFFLFIPVYFFTGIRRPETKMNTIVSTVLLIAVTGIQFTLTGLSPRKNDNISSFIQSEQLLRKMQNPTATPKLHNNGIAQNIQQLCGDIKSLIFMDMTGKPVIATPIDETLMAAQDDNLGADFRNNGKGQQLMMELKTAIDQYNAAQKNAEDKLSVTHSILEADFNKLDRYNELFVLNNLTQIQLSLAYANTNAVISMK